MDKNKITPLVIKAQKGDQAALQDLLSECYQSLYYFAYKTTKNEDLAADITQEGCIEIITSLHNLHDPAAFSSWAHRIIYFQCTRHFRAPQELPFEENEDGETILDILPDTDGVLPEQVVEDKEFQRTLQNMLDQLPAEQRSALLLYYYERLSVKQIADIQRTTEGTVKSRLNYGRKAVKNQVEDYEKKTGIKLHSIAPLPMLLFFLFRQEMQSAGVAASVVLPAITAAIPSAASGTAVKAAGAAVSKKVIAVALAAVAAATAAVGAVHVFNNRPWDPSASASQSHSGSASHRHSYPSDWEYDATEHWQVCECGEKSDSGPHSYQGRACTACGRLLESEGLEFWLNDDAASYRCHGLGDCEDSDVVIPAEYKGLPVTGIGPQAFSFAQSLTSVVIPDSISHIENRAFWGCSSLRSITIPESVTRIDDYAFWKCSSLTEIKLPSKLGKIAPFTFDDCSSLTSLVIPDGVVKIEEGAFYNCTALQTLTIPASVKEIGGLAFCRCTSLREIRFGGKIAQWTEFENKTYRVLFGQDWAGIRRETANYAVHCSDGKYVRPTPQ